MPAARIIAGASGALIMQSPARAVRRRHGATARKTRYDLSAQMIDRDVFPLGLTGIRHQALRSAPELNGGIEFSLEKAPMRLGCPDNILFPE